MTNTDIKQELIFVHESLHSLKTLSMLEVPALELNSFIHLLEEKYDELHTNLVSLLDNYELSVTLSTEGKDAALKLLEQHSESTTSP